MHEFIARATSARYDDGNICDLRRVNSKDPVRSRLFETHQITLRRCVFSTIS